MRSVPRRLRVPGASPVMAAFWTSRVCAPWRRCIFQTKAGRRCPGLYGIDRRIDLFGPCDCSLQHLLGARVVDNRSFDLPKAIRRQIAAKLEKSGVAPQKTGKLKEFMPVGRSERISLHDESLPSGLILSES